VQNLKFDDRGPVVTPSLIEVYEAQLYESVFHKRSVLDVVQYCEKLTDRDKEMIVYSFYIWRRVTL
jgi:hypothetical protein